MDSPFLKGIRYGLRQDDHPLLKPALVHSDVHVLEVTALEPCPPEVLLGRRRVRRHQRAHLRRHQTGGFHADPRVLSPSALIQWLFHSSQPRETRSTSFGNRPFRL